MTVLDFYNHKVSQKKISMVTCYDYSSARILSETSIDALLVGDSVAMTMHGFNDTLSATLDMMAIHTSAVRRGAGNKFIITDLPFLSYRKSLSKSMSAVEQLMQSGAHAIKLEGASGNFKLIKHTTESGIPVMGHLGLTPQFIHMLSGYKTQGKTQESANLLKEQAFLLQEAGCFAIVLECIPHLVAKEITASLTIPTIGIGAGSFTDGQVLVFQDLLGLNIDFKPKFVKTFMNGRENFISGIDAYIQAIKFGEFPNHENCN